MVNFRRIAGVSLAAVVGLAAGCSGETKIGAVISTSGAVGVYGVQVKKGIDLALDEINAAGGWNGGSIVLIHKDDATNIERGEQVVRELIDQDGVNMIIGAVSSTVTLRIAPICEEEGVLLLSPSASAPEISAAGDYIFRNYPSDVLEGTSMARFGKDEGFERVVIFAIDNPFGKGLAQVFTEEYEGRFRSVVGTFRYPEGQNSGFGSLIEEAKKLNPEGIYIVAYDQLGALLTEMKAAGLEGVRMATSSVPENISAQAGEAAEKLIFPRPGFDVGSSDPAVVQFVSAYRDRYGEDPDSYAAHGYDALKLYVAALEAAESAHPDNVKIGLTSIKNFHGAAGITSFDKNGDVIRYPRLFVVNGGRPMPYEQFKEQGLTLVYAPSGR